MKWESFVSQLALEEDLIYAVLSNVRKKSEKQYDKVTFRPLIVKEEVVIQMEGFMDNKAFHENLPPLQAMERLTTLMLTEFKQCHLFMTQKDYQVLVNRQGDAAIKSQAPTKIREIQAHNRKKHYALEEGQPVNFLIALGVMDEQGKVFKKKFDKFKQLNKFLEFIEATLPQLEDIDCIRILDFGCGKAYLTFALYHYLVNVKGRKVAITGLDLKDDVIEYCSSVAKSLHYEGLEFKIGNIKDYELSGNVDLVVTLHACDNATDEAIAKSVEWGAKVILSVPCCQHEFFKQLASESQEPILKHGILRDKLSSLVTDAYRGLVLEALGYEVQMMEFIDMTHTPKNVLIRAYKRNDFTESDRIGLWDEADAFKKAYSLNHTYLEGSLKNKQLI